MDLIRLSHTLGVCALYLGFAGVLGVLLRRLLRGARDRWDRPLAFSHALLLHLPATLLIANYPGWSVEARLSLLLAGQFVVLGSAVQPVWLPPALWSRSFGLRYFACAMILAATWGLGLTLATQALLPALLAAAASLAGAASIYNAPRVG